MLTPTSVRCLKSIISLAMERDVQWWLHSRQHHDGTDLNSFEEIAPDGIQDPTYELRCSELRVQFSVVIFYFR